MENTISNDKIIIRTKDKDFKDLILIKETRSNQEVWFKVPDSVSSPDITLVIEELNTQISKLKNSCNKDEIILFNHFKSFIKEIAEYHLKNGAIITEDNIHLYYEFMSHDDIQSNIYIVTTILSNRFEIIRKQINIEKDDIKLYLNFRIKRKEGKITIGSSACGIVEIFGIKDILSPIDEYLEEIKKTEEYKISIQG